MKASVAPFGKVEGRGVDLFTLDNGAGMTVKITNYGGIVTSIVIPDKGGKRGDITCGFDALDGYFGEAYRGNAPYFGCIVGRYAGRIKDAVFEIGGQRYPLAKNADPNHLHGGVRGFDKRVWDAAAFEEKDGCGVRLSLLSPDGDEGYPGNLRVVVEYRLTEKNELRMRYTAETDKATPVSLTNHAYFNLNGFADKILDHTAQIVSGRFLVPDETNVPVGEERRVLGRAEDFSSPRRIGDAFADLPLGFEHYYVFAKPAGTLAKVAVFSEPGSGRTLEVGTTEPGMLFYTGRYTSDDLRREDGTRFGQFRAFCCETMKYPNGPNIPGSPASVLEPGRRYDETTIYRLKW